MNRGALDGEISSRLARAEARVSLARLHDDIKPVRFLLTTRMADREQLADGVAQCRLLLEEYAKIKVRESDPALVSRLREDFSEMLFLSARAGAVQASTEKDRARRTEQAQLALRLNEQAEEWGSRSRALLLQRAELQRLLQQ